MLLPEKVKIIFKDGQVLFGYIQSFEDFKKLKKNDRFKFLPDSKDLKIINSESKSITIEVKDVETIDFNFFSDVFKL